MVSRNALILSSISLTALLASPAFAQTASPVDTTPQKTQEGEANPPTSAPTNAKGQPASTGSIVVTGSRIRRNNFNTPQNVDILTRDDQILSGTRSTADTLQSATVTSGTSQISSSFLGYLSEGGQAANTVGLRGLGSARTLVLLNGRRLAPAGVGPQLVSADLNVLPTSIVQRIEVLREGASSIYGSDAIAGVINIITDTSINGVTIDAYADHPLIGAGDTLRASITAGKTFSRGHITGAIEVRDDEGLRVGDNPDWACPRELAYINGAEIGQTEPGSSKLRCFSFQRGGAGGTANGYGLAYGPRGFRGRFTLPGYNTGNPTLGTPILVNNNNLRPLERDVVFQSTVFSPIRTYSAYVNGAYDLGMLGNSELYGEALFTRRKSHQDNTTQLNFQGVNEAVDYYGGCPPSPGSGCSPFFPTSFVNAGITYFGPFIEPSRTIRNAQKVDFFRANAGLRGNAGIGDWRYDANYQVSRTWGTEDIQYPLESRVANTLRPVIAPTGTPSEFTVTALPGQAGAGNTYTCASNLTNNAYNGGQCVPINYLDPAVFINGQLPDALFNYLYPNNRGKTRYQQDTLNVAFDGSLFHLPGGDLKGAFGFEHRRDHIDDRPAPARQSGDIYQYSTAQRTVGTDKVNEVFAELNAPIFRDRPFFNLLELDGSVRYTHYKSYGSGWTYHVNGQWAPFAALRFRGNYGTNFRAPNLYEQFVADQKGFYPGSYDPCNDFTSSYSPGSTVYNNCLAALTPILGAGATNFLANTGIPVTTKGGAGILKAEKAKTYGFGAVVTVPRNIADLSFTVDYWHVKVKGEVNLLGNLILSFCYSAADFPNNQYCSLIGPRNTSGTHPGAISSFVNPYINVSQQVAAGIDFGARYATRMFGGRFQTQLQATRNIHQQLEYFAGDGLNEYNGTLGYPGNGAGPKWVGSLDTRFSTANNITLRWGIQYVGKSNSTRLANDIFLTSTGQTCSGANCLPVHYDLTAETYIQHDVSVQFQWPTVGQFTLGVTNLFNRKPPVISSFPDQSASYPRIGNYFGNGPYSYRGRSIFANVTRTFK